MIPNLFDNLFPLDFSPTSNLRPPFYNSVFLFDMSLISLIPPEVLIFNRGDGDCTIFLSSLNLLILLSLSHCPPQFKQGQLLLHCFPHREMIHWVLPTQMHPIFSVTCLIYLDLFIHSSWNFGLTLYTFFNRIRYFLSSCLPTKHWRGYLCIVSSCLS